MRTFLLTLCLALLAAGPAKARDLPSARPESVGVSSERLKKINEFSQRWVDEGKYAGIVTMVSRHGKIIHFNAVGQYGIDNDKPIARDTLFRIFSMTKAITSVAAMMLYEDGAFHMADPVAKYLPELAGVKLLKDGELVDPQQPMNIEHLMTHTAGLTYGATPDNPVDIAYQEAKLFESKDLDEFVGKLAELPLRFEPGTRYHYSVATDVLGALVERVSGMTLEAFFEERIFKPLDMEDTFFSVPQEKRDRLATNHTWDAEAGKLAPVPPEYDLRYDNVTLFSGGGGLVSTIDDYMRFLEMLRRGGTLDGQRIISPKTVEYMTSDHLTPEVWAEGRGEYPAADFYPGQSMGLGFGVIIKPALNQVLSSKGEYSWGGAAGTKYWVDPKEELVAVAMVQLFGSPWPLRNHFKVAILQSLTELEP